MPKQQKIGQIKIQKNQESPKISQQNIITALWGFRKAVINKQIIKKLLSEVNDIAAGAMLYNKFLERFKLAIIKHAIALKDEMKDSEGEQMLA